jgi:hypothetical protein
MAILQGSGYELPIRITSPDGRVITDADVVAGSFTFGELEKEYGEGGEVYFDGEQESWILPLSEEETFAMRGTVEWQARFLMVDGKPDGTIPKYENVYSSINKRRFTAGGDENA